MDVIYAAAKPEFQEFGAYVYRETDTYDNVSYSNQNNSISDGD